MIRFYCYKQKLPSWIARADNCIVTIHCLLVVFWTSEGKPKMARIIRRPKAETLLITGDGSKKCGNVEMRGLEIINRPYLRLFQAVRSRCYVLLGKFEMYD